MGRLEVIKQIDKIPVKITWPNWYYWDPNFASVAYAELER